MPSYENPFPGMNPYLQGDWTGVHTLRIGYIHDALATELPPDLAARAEERITIASEDEEKARARRVDVAVVENWRAGFPPVWTPEGEASPGGAVVDEPLIFLEDPEPERWVEIRNASGRWITVIEVLSPANKGAGWAEYKARQRDFLAAGVALVEIDLIRGGLHTVAIGSDHLPPAEGTRHLVCVARPHTGIQRREVTSAHCASGCPPFACRCVSTTQMRRSRSSRWSTVATAWADTGSRPTRVRSIRPSRPTRPRGRRSVCGPRVLHRDCPTAWR